MKLTKQAQEILNRAQAVCNPETIEWVQEIIEDNNGKVNAFVKRNTLPYIEKAEGLANGTLKVVKVKTRESLEMNDDVVTLNKVVKV